MKIKQYKYAIFFGIIAFILLNISILVNIPFSETRSPFLELIYLLSMMLGLISFITAIILAMIKNQELNKDYEQIK